MSTPLDPVSHSNGPNISRFTTALVAAFISVTCVPERKFEMVIITIGRIIL